MILNLVGFYHWSENDTVSGSILPDVPLMMAWWGVWGQLNGPLILHLIIITFVTSSYLSKIQSNNAQYSAMILCSGPFPAYCHQEEARSIWETVNNHHLMRSTDDLHAASHSGAARVQGPVLGVKGSQSPGHLHHGMLSSHFASGQLI